MFIKRCEMTDIWEFNTLESLWNFDKEFRAADISPTMRRICQELKIEDERELLNFALVKDGSGIAGCSFLLADSQYRYMLSTRRVEKC
jgi:hypothetical protein